MENRLVLFALFLLWILVIAFLNLAMITTATASPHQHDVNIDINLESPPSVSSTPEPLDNTAAIPSADDDISRAVALSGAVNHQFDWSTHRFQASANAAFYDGQQAISFGMAKRFHQVDALWHTSISIPDGGSDELVTFGATWRW